MTEASTATLTVRYSRTAVHIAGFDPAQLSGGNDLGSHISYRPDSHCSALTRGIVSMGVLSETIETRHEDDPTVPAGKVRRVSVWREFATGQEAYDAALAEARRNGGARICEKCTAAAVKAGATV